MVWWAARTPVTATVRHHLNDQRLGWAKQKGDETNGAAR